MSEKVLVIGSGGREHALAWKLAKSPLVGAVYVAPGNAGTTGLGKVSNVAVNVKDFGEVVSWCKQHSISLVVIGPEDPLADGIADTLKENAIPCFGPTAAAAQIEASKAFSKEFMTRHKIPTARWQAFTDPVAAETYINTAHFEALVVKASGLAAGKGVIVARDRAEACRAARDMLQGGKFGTAGSTVVVEELLVGEEVSCLAFSDGKTIACFPPAQDHKRAQEGDRGPNTGGMGAYCPCPLVSAADMAAIRTEVLQRAVDGLAGDGTPYVGVLYAGLMLTERGPMALEYNCRFGDPETQVLLPLMETDLYKVMLSCTSGTLASVAVTFTRDETAVAVVVVSGGYPGAYKKGCQIEGLKQVLDDGNLVFHAGTAIHGGNLVTSGGRVLAVVALDNDLERAARQAHQGAACVHFEDSFYRKDIAQKAVRAQCPVGLSYKEAGVDIAAGDSLVSGIKTLAAMTARPGSSPDLGLFGGLFDLKVTAFKDPLLVSGTDGVGTKLKVARLSGLHSTVGEDLVAMCVNDVLCHGAEPLFFLDYFATGRLDVGVARAVIGGVAAGCRLAGCALIGGETAEMPGMYAPGDYDLAGFTVGAVERLQYLPRTDHVTEGDVVVAVGSSGLHSNGFSLVRKVVERCGAAYTEACPWDATTTLGAALLTPTCIYPRAVLPVLRGGRVKVVTHITGGGLPGNACRGLPARLGATLSAATWRVQPVFGWLQEKGTITCGEMLCTFNCGVGLLLVVAPQDADDVIQQLVDSGQRACRAGHVHACTEGKERVIVNDIEPALKAAWQEVKRSLQSENPAPSVGRQRRRVAVLISGSGTNLQALLDHVMNATNESAAHIVLVVSNKAGVEGLERARRAGVPTKVISHKDFKSREDFDDHLHETLQEFGVEMICLAGFMRILSGGFVRLWHGRMINVHPSLLPAFKGAHAHSEVIAARVRISGCTVHFVTDEVDSGAILMQESVPVFPTDTEVTVAARVKTVEHVAFPKAMEMVASGTARLGSDNVIQWDE